MAEHYYYNSKDLKKIFRESVKLLHPDRGGDREEFLKFLSWYNELPKSVIRPQRLEAKRGTYRPGPSFFKTITLSIKEVSLGLRKKIKLPLKEIDCPYCQGLGIDQSRNKVACSYCAGEGVLKLNSGDEVILQRCPFCAGRGYFYRETCPHCRGKGKLKEEMEIEISLPLGLREGDLLFISKEALGTKTDFYIEIELERHPFWRLEGPNLIYELKIPFWEILLEEFIDIETLEGKERIPTILFRKGDPVILPKRGPFLPDDNLWKRGDLIIYLKPLFPESLSAMAKRYLEKFKHTLMEERYEGP